MVRNKKFHVFRAVKRTETSWSGKNDNIPSPTLIWAKDFKDAQSIVHAGGNDLKSVVIVELKD